MTPFDINIDEFSSHSNIGQKVGMLIIWLYFFQYTYTRNCHILNIN